MILLLKYLQIKFSRLAIFTMINFFLLQFYDE